MAIDKNEIEKRPLTTNKLDIVWNKRVFFEKYAIVSYYSKTLKNIAYEQLATAQKISVAGLWAKWTKDDKSSQKFFVLTQKNRVNEVVKDLRTHPELYVSSDNLENYDEDVQLRIIASLTVNSLASSKNKMIYSNGVLFLCDELNFLVPRSSQELVCLKITIDSYLHLVAETTTFIHPRSINELKKNIYNVFHLSRVKDGNWWPGMSIQPITSKDIDLNKVYLEEYYIQGKWSTSSRNLVNYWPYDKLKFNHGKLFAMTQVIGSVNEMFDSMVHLSFHQIKKFDYEECNTSKETLPLLVKYMTGRTIYFDDPFKNTDSKELVRQLQENIKDEKLLGNVMHFSDKPTANNLIIRLCEEKDEKVPISYYSQAEKRELNDFCFAVQHVTLPLNKEVKCSRAETRRDLLDLLVKDCNTKFVMPEELIPATNGWEFIRYKINKGFIKGASLIIDHDGKMTYKRIGFKGDILDMDYEEFIQKWLCYDQPEKFNGYQDYMAMKKGGNVYMIIDTGEIPILDAAMIDKAYHLIESGEKKSRTFMKNKDEAPKYLRGYIGLNMWKSEDLEGNPESAYSYISGFFWGLLNLSQGNMDRVPRVRKLFILKQEHPEQVESHIQEIKDLLKAGFGRWNEYMTYPYPFKFLQEYLDYASEVSYSCHWSEITRNKELD
ncbi:hypothetical protein [Phocaeicola sp.]